MQDHGRILIPEGRISLSTASQNRDEREALYPADNPQSSGTFTPAVIEDIQVKAELGRYRIRGFGTLRPRTWATFDDLTFIPCGLTRIPLEGYRESCSTKTVLGARFAEKPIELDIPIMVTGMSYGALSYNAKVALARGEIGR